MKPETKSCQNCKADFTIEPEDFDFYKKIDVPAPTWCPECRLKRRIVWRNQNTIYRRKAENSGKDILASFPPVVSGKVYEIDYWRSDKWDGLDYGRDYDFKRPFFDQFRELLHDVPWPSKSVLDMVNSEYCDQASYCKNCYMCFDIDYSEDSSYVVRAKESKRCVDAYELRKCELCYESYMLRDSYKVMYSVNCESSSDVWFSKNLVGCTNCFGCVNLRNKSYYIFNEKHPKESYEKFMSDFVSGSYRAVQAMTKKAEEFWLKFPVRFSIGTRNLNSTGYNIHTSKNVNQSFDVFNGENLKYCQIIQDRTVDSYDYTVWGDNASQVYEAMTCGINCDTVRFCFDTYLSVKDVTYCIFCRSSSNLFGCVGLKSNQYCILNKQYSKQEYKELMGRIVKQMDEMPYTDAQGRVYKFGEFFPVDMSPFAYNQTIAQEYFPLTKGEAEKSGHRWAEPSRRDYEVTMKAEELPDNITDVEEGILEEVIECEHGGKCKDSCSTAFKLTPAELQFYKKMKLPLPRLCPKCRLADRLKKRNPLKLWTRQCMCDYEVYDNNDKHSHHKEGRCPNEFETSYAPDRKEIVYCETCYQSEII